ncbi:MAG: ATP-binding protein [Actinomycetota bacterium]
MATPCPSCNAINDDAARFCASCGTRLALRCSVCGAEVPPEARFCPACGAPLVAPTSPEAPLEERRVVTIVFADLAGFTQHSDQADPEDVRRILVPFHEVAKEEIERFGGTLDKFIGDAAMGVFGAPMAHEDDPERAVRAALAIRDRAVGGGGLPVRIAVHTGEALVTFGEGPQVGERVAGDVVNTASRLQSFAPEGSVIVGEPTERATRHVVEYEAMPATKVKGKAEPVTSFVARAIRADTPEREEDDPPPFVGRVRERELLHDLLTRTVGDHIPRLVTIVGEPGIGKTRLVQGLHDHLRSTHEGVAWHRGRCRPFGESITYAALEELVRSIARIPVGATPAEIADLMADELSSLETQEADRGWLGSRLRPLVGLPVGDDTSASIDESFTAWSRYLELAAGRRPITLVVEDLHWADDPLLEFLERLVQRAPDVPMFVVCTGRPELYARRPSWAAGIPDTTTIALSPLSDHEMQELLEGLLMRSVLSSDASDALLRRAGGNPLYAREFVHMLEDRGSGGEVAGDTAASPGVLVPDTVQALIAARLDALEPSDRGLLQVASVVGDRFWRGSLTTLEPGVTDLDGSLHALQRRGLIRRAASSSIGGEAEFSFAHALIRDVAYGRLPRTARSRLHRGVAAWLETAEYAATTSHADLLASHAVRALELARSAGLDDDLPELEATALRYLTMAGDRQQSIDAGRAADYYEEALALATPGATRADLRRRAAGQGWRSGRTTSDETLDALLEAEREAAEAGDRRLTARVLRRVYFQLGLRGDTAGAHDALERAIALVQHDPDAQEEVAELYACRSEAEMLAGRSDESLRWAERALELPRTETVSLMALHLRGNARCETGDLGGVDDLREAVAVAEASGVAIDIVTSYSYLLEWVGLQDGPSVALPMNRATADLCHRRGLEGQAMWTRAEEFWLLFDAGLWDELSAFAEELGGWAEKHGDAQIATVSSLYRARVLAHRGGAGAAVEMAAVFLPTARQIEDLQVLAPALMAATVAHAAAGDVDGARSLAAAFDEATGSGPTEYRELYLPEVVRVLVSAGAVEQAERLIGERAVHVLRTRLAVASSRALVAEARGDSGIAAEAFTEAAEGWGTWGGIFERAHALAGQARSLAALGRNGDAGAARREAERIFTRLGVQPPA